MGHLTKEERRKATTVLSKYKDIMSMSKSYIGRTHVNMFDTPSDNLHPIADPLRRVPFHKESIVKERLENYEQLCLIKKTDSPFREVTVLVGKKNVSDSVDLTDKYRLSVDYRSLNALSTIPKGQHLLWNTV